MESHRIIINADDYLAFDATNEAILSAFASKSITCASALATGPDGRAMATNLAALAPWSIEVGLHLNLSFGTPLSPAFRKVGNRFTPPQETTEAYLAEFEAQYERLASWCGGRISHIDAHRPEIYFDPLKYGAHVSLAAARGKPMRSPFGLAAGRFVERVAKGSREREKGLMALVERQKSLEEAVGVLRCDAFLSMEMFETDSAGILAGLFRDAARPLTVELGVHVHREEEVAALRAALRSLDGKGFDYELTTFATAFEKR